MRQALKGIRRLRRAEKRGFNPFRSAIEVLARKGWIKRAQYRAGEGVCVGGALSCALYGRTHGDVWFSPEAEVVREVIREQYPEVVAEARIFHDDQNDVELIARFNDRHAELDDAVRVLEKAAIRWDEQVTTNGKGDAA